MLLQDQPKGTHRLQGRLELQEGKERREEGVRGVQGCRVAGVTSSDANIQTWMEVSWTHGTMRCPKRNSSSRDMSYSPIPNKGLRLSSHHAEVSCALRLCEQRHQPGQQVGHVLPEIIAQLLCSSRRSAGASRDTNRQQQARPLASHARQVHP